MHNSTLEWDNALALTTYCFNRAPSVNDLESPFYLKHGRDPLEAIFKTTAGMYENNQVG